MNELQIFQNNELELKVRTVLNEDGSISVNAEDTAIGFGWTQIQNKNGKQYTSIRWETIDAYCEEFGFPNKLGKDDFIPESLFYMLGMKASNKVAQKFQKWLAVDVIPSIRKKGSYSVNNNPNESQLKIEELNKFIQLLEPSLNNAGINPIEKVAIYQEVLSNAGINIPIDLHEAMQIKSPTLNNINAHSDEFERFLSEHCDINPGFRVKGTEFNQLYKQWATQNNLVVRKIGIWLRIKGFKYKAFKENGKNVKGYAGLQIRK